MMKPLKARGISKETGEMVYGQVIERYGKIYIYDKIKLPEYLDSFIYEDSDEEEIREEEVKLIYAGPKRYLTQIIVQGSEIKPETLGYATGIKDIYSDDILEDAKQRKVVCVWFQGNAEFIMVDTSEYTVGNKDEPAYIAEFESWLGLAKIGNIHQNKELLGEE